MNTQPIEKQVLREDGLLEVHSIFYTIQGEGPFAGRPAIFVRLAGCNLQCPGCDTDYTSDRRMTGPVGLLELVNVCNVSADLVVITGGEPFRQNISPAVDALLFAGYNVQIETNGTLYLEDLRYEDVTIICSPKTGKLNQQLTEHPDAISAFKYILTAGNAAPDGLPISALGHPVAREVARPPAGFSGSVILQPADEKDPVKNAANIEECVQSCLAHGHTLGLQLHKFLGLD